MNFASLPKTAVRHEHMNALPHAEFEVALKCVKRSDAYNGTVRVFECLLFAAAARAMCATPGGGDRPRRIGSTGCRCRPGHSKCVSGMLH